MYIREGGPRLQHLIFADNQARFGGGLYVVDDDPNPEGFDLELTDVVFRNNAASGEGGGLATFFRADEFFPPTSLTLTDVVFENNTAVRTGGGMILNGGNLQMLNVTFTGNTAAAGGGMSNFPWIISTLTNVTFSHNSASEAGRGMLSGGEINSSNDLHSILTNVTFDNNSTPGSGGGIHHDGGPLYLTNVTFSRNEAGTRGGGISNGGFFSAFGGVVDVTNATFSENAAAGGGDAINNQGGTVTIRNSILYNNPGEAILGAATVSHSIVQGGYPGTGNLDADPLLGPLQDNGGFTRTMALGELSPAINTGDNSICPATDERGVARPQGGGCDMGAYESEFANAFPRGIELSSSTVDENQPVGATVGTLSTSDPDPADSHTYSFCGGVDDASLSIAGNLLKTAAVFDYETRTSYSVCIRSTDGGGLSTTSTFVIGVNDLVDTQTFGDVPETYWAWNFIERLYTAGITGAAIPIRCSIVPRARSLATRSRSSCCAGSMAPPTLLRRWAVARALAMYLPHWAAAWIKQLAAEGITGGCGNGDFCPEQPVTRDQMAVFLLKAKHGKSYSPPAVDSSTGFTDVPPNHWAAAWIQQLVAEGITAGCGSGNYCPGAPVTRAQMAVFLVKAFGLP